MTSLMFFWMCYHAVRDHGFSPATAKTVANVLTRHYDFFLQEFRDVPPLPEDTPNPNRKE